ncbi:16S rRNA (cytosine(1402)-N(4))-methyltransferase [Candidatus Woesebacteria bacterium GWC2_33_12]|uniref:Ribosomal RNA small subunit methyltransferase H n=1 Tax=Candidatus Woesebacteria bacterium GW2011_GWB1_33_22 TaxID=1618566 RepID=A0A0G0A2T7_9BACT|nr:MAG: Ribosomal RNA small subunit methyltransferase H [Candidatus Woesebacteria bacterium GW2011_GWC2_33_12]KKP42699.1 MAG: Ribosomal RNA small subunit methyltransferase H [Candidatus Woesebacteria bacterium GW2011_GWA2_33_20]KKP45526.1 MAG: Ribosomal RNA small subunit methyltransferase H [Candidatus Woesebacteria bacterium GW2011_GWB1_33_22]KKP47398.1 MAG: Ribosomal RNA small subunit methyltransferase H [Microgenomates group bacterium GW2011_GWC1_33_28]KKP51144.1 MAG: Ribosomal RNA small sub
MQNNWHESVMIEEVIKEMPKGKVIDCTLGTGGHTEALLKKGCEVLAIEVDPKILEIAKKRLGNKAKLVLGNFSELDKIAKENSFDKVDGILFDLGVSNLHLKEDSRGFSFTESEQELDMRLNPENQGVKAMDLLNALNVGQLTNLFGKVMNRDLSRKWANEVLFNRPFKTVADLKKTAFNMPHKKSLDSATLPMLALRIAVNSEYENLETALPKAFSLLKRKGKLLVITFHSGEERILEDVVGRGFIIYPSEEEIRSNPRSRSAKLHIYDKN